MTPAELIPNGVLLSAVPGLSARQIKTLNDAWIDTAQELVALAECPEVVRTPLARALGVDQAGLDAVVVSARAAIPITREPRSARSLQLGLEAAQADYGRGALLDEPPEEIARRRALPAYEPPRRRGVLPPSSDLLDRLPNDVRSQGGRGTCVAHAVVAVREQLEIAAGAARDINLSEQFVYWWCKTHDGIPRTSGTYVSVGMRCLREMGAPPEDGWPYVSHPQGPDESQGPPPARCAQGDAAMRTLRTIELNPSDIQGIKTCLAEGRAVAYSVPVFDSWYHSEATRRWGKITLPLPGEAPDGGHAMTLVGYRDDAAAPGGGYFLVRNSWQPWAYDGTWCESYGYIAYAYIRKHADAVFSAERVEAAEVYLRDAADDTGRRPLPHPSWNSPDIRLRREDLSQDGAHQRAKPGALNALFVTVHQRGPANAYQVQVELYAAPLSPWVRHEDWQLIGRSTAPVVPPGAQVLGPLFWPVPAPGPDQYAFRARVGADTDQPSPVYSAQAVERHLWLAEMAPGETCAIAFDVYGVGIDSGISALRVERGDAPAEVGISAISLASDATGETDQPRDIVDEAVTGALTGAALLAAGAHRRASLQIALPPDVAPGLRFTFSVAQFVGNTLAGRMPVQVTVT